MSDFFDRYGRTPLDVTSKPINETDEQIGKSEVDLATEKINEFDARYGRSAPGNEFLTGPSSAFDRKYGVPVDPAAKQAVEDDLAQMEPVAEQLGVLDKAKNAALTVVTPIMDVLSRLNYASAGAAEELFTERGARSKESVLGRVGRELFSGVGKLKGDKETYAQIFEQSGFGKGFEFSEMMPWLYSESGNEWLKFKKEGLLDWTGRGVAGFAGDVLLDPLTYFTFGSRNALKIALKSGERARPLAIRALSKGGEKALVEETIKTLGLTARGAETFRQKLFTSLPNLSGDFILEKANPAVQRAYLESVVKKGLEEGADVATLNAADTAKIALEGLEKGNVTKELTDILRNAPALSDMPTEVSHELTRTASRAAEDAVSALYFSDPKRYGKELFADGGMKWMGLDVPGTGKVARRMSEISLDTKIAISQKLREVAKGSDVADWILEKSRGTAGFLNAAMRTFTRDKTVDPLALMGKQKIIDMAAMRRAQHGSEIQKTLGHVNMSQKQWEQTITEIDNATRDLTIEQFKDPAGMTKLLDGRSSLVPDIIARATAAAHGHDLLKSVKPEDLSEVIKYTVKKLDELDAAELGGWKAEMIEQLGKSVPATSQFTPGNVLRNAETRLSKIISSLAQTPADMEAFMSNLGSKVERLLSPNGELFEGIAKDMKVVLSVEDRVALQKYLTEKFTRQLVTNVPMFFDNRSSKITQALHQINKKLGYEYTESEMIGHRRAFYSPVRRSEFEDAAKQIQGSDLKAPILRPVRDIREILRNRVDMHAEETMLSEWKTFLKDNFDVDLNDGQGALAKTIFRDLSLDKFELTKAERDAIDAEHLRWLASDEKGIADRAAMENKRGYKGDVKTLNALPDALMKTIKGWSPEKQRYWIAQEFLHEHPQLTGKAALQSRRDFSNVFTRYAELIAKDPDLLPKWKDMQEFERFQGAMSRPLEIHGAITNKTIDVPIDIFHDYTSMRDELIRSRDVIDILRAYDGLNRIFKTYVTAPFPSFHFRNAYGNLALGFADISLGALNPRDHALASAIVARTWLQGRGRISTAEAAKTLLKPSLIMGGVGAAGGALAGVADYNQEEGLAGLGKSILKGAALGAGVGAGFTAARRSLLKEGGLVNKGYKELGEIKIATKRGVYSVDEIEQLARQYGVWTDDIKLFELQGEYSPYGASRLNAKRKNFEQELRSPGEAIENEARLMLFIRHIRNGLSPQEAAARVKEFLFDYSNISAAERQVFRRVFPFWTFMRRNIPLQVKSLVRNPGNIATQVKFLQERTNESDRMALYDSNGTWVRLNGDGRRLEIMSGVDLPTMQLNSFDVLLGRQDRARELLSMVNPLIRMAWELPLNVETLTGKSLDRRRNDSIGRFVEKLDLPQSTRNFLGYQKTFDRAGRPVYSLDGQKLYTMLEGWALSRMVRTSDKVFSAMVNGGDSGLLQFLMTGTRNKEVDLEEQDYLKLKQRQQAVKQELLKRGVKNLNSLGQSEY